jgi:sigma-B regulation protein RsbU (phosphoserine phosphatase)
MMPMPPGSSDLLEGLGAREILNSLADGVYITDASRRILFWNHAAERITGWPAKEVVGTRCQDNILVHIDKDGHELCGHELCPLRRSIVTGQPSPKPLLVFAKSKSGKRVPVEVTTAPIQSADGRVVGGIELFRDVTGPAQDMMRAKTIQQGCLQCAPSADDRVQWEVRYTPSDIVGGDFYRVERLGADRYTLFVADMMGHGVAAALYSVQLRSFWEDQRSQLNSPATFLTALNSRLHALAPEAGSFATAVCANIDAATGEMTYVCAGHPPPLILRANGYIDRARDPQPALGMFAGLDYTNWTERLLPGDTLLLYTDGAVEVTNARDEQLGVAGLSQLIGEQLRASPDRQLQLAKLEEQLLLYSNAIRLPDDLTLLKLQRLK